MLNSLHQDYTSVGSTVHTGMWPTTTGGATTSGMAEHEREALVRVLADFPVQRLRDIVAVSDGMAIIHIATRLENLPLDSASTLCAIADGRDIPAPAAKPVTVGNTTVHRPKHFFVGSVRLTERQKQVLEMVAKGASNRTIGAKLRITDGTVKVHITEIFKALGVENRTQAAVVAGQLGLGD